MRHVIFGGSLPLLRRRYLIIPYHMFPSYITRTQNTSLSEDHPSFVLQVRAREWSWKSCDHAIETEANTLIYMCVEFKRVDVCSLSSNRDEALKSPVIRLKSIAVINASFEPLEWKLDEGYIILLPGIKRDRDSFAWNEKFSVWKELYLEDTIFNFENISFLGNTTWKWYQEELK